MQAVVTAAMAVQTLLFAATAAPHVALFPSPTSARRFHRASNFRGTFIRPSPPQRPSAASPVLPLAVEEDEAAAAIAGEGQRRGGGSSNRIQVSNTKKPLFFYVNLAKRYMQQHGEVELSALGMAIATVVTVAEILKNNGLAVEKKIRTSTVEINDESRGRPLQKAKIEIVVGKSDKFDELMAAAAEEREAGDGEEQA